jgi:hypothetical protein
MPQPPAGCDPATLDTERTRHPSGYRGTFTVPAKHPACVLMTPSGSSLLEALERRAGRTITWRGHRPTRSTDRL